MDMTLHYAFIDESGTVGSTGTHFLVVAVLTAVTPRDLELPVRRALKKYGRSLTKGEIKATHASVKTNLRMLEAIASHEVSIVAVIVDQQAIVRQPKDPEEIYRQAVARAIHILLEHFPRVEICLDKRYTNEILRYELEKHIRENLVDISPQLALIRQQSSHTRKELQAADAVAWAFFQKYERGNSRFYDVIASKVLLEELIAKKKWK
ncbi:MAG: hypothetical protein A3K41_14510 [Chloroflexi bacterium RIFOXYD12_FULL_57_15]|nr:MAG: hypothetical protein A3K41_14510 [Chloroflexi bacterium RIFOXYD12_FULL_57_15]